MSKNYYIVEGPTEENFLSQLIKLKIIKAGKIFRHNIMQKKISYTSNILTKSYDNGYLIIDTDEGNMNKSCLVTLRDNISTLKSSVRNIFIIVQNKELEDELRYVFQNNSLDTIFSVKYNTTTELKRHLQKNNIYTQLIKQDRLTIEMLQRYGTRPNEFRQFLEQNSLCKISTMIKDFTIIHMSKR